MSLGGEIKAEAGPKADDKASAKGSPGPHGEEFSTRGPNGRPDQVDPLGPCEASGELEVFGWSLLVKAPKPPKELPADEDRLIAVGHPAQPAPYIIQQTH